MSTVMIGVAFEKSFYHQIKSFKKTMFIDRLFRIFGTRGIESAAVTQIRTDKDLVEIDGDN